MDREYLTPRQRERFDILEASPAREAVQQAIENRAPGETSKEVVRRIVRQGNAKAVELCRLYLIADYREQRPGLTDCRDHTGELVSIIDPVTGTHMERRAIIQQMALSLLSDPPDTRTALDMALELVKRGLYSREEAYGRVGHFKQQLGICMGMPPHQSVTPALPPASPAQSPA